MPKRSSLIGIAQRLREDLSGLRFGPPVYYVYDPLTYAWAPHRKYLARFGKGQHKVLIVGMNAGYFGMVQTGGLGRFAERHVAKVLGDTMTCGGAPHPSPANTQVSLDGPPR